MAGERGSAGGSRTAPQRTPDAGERANVTAAGQAQAAAQTIAPALAEFNRSLARTRKAAPYLATGGC